MARWSRLGPSVSRLAAVSALYFKAPWGLKMEAITYPDGMAYEKDSPVKLWSPKDQPK